MLEERVNHVERRLDAADSNANRVELQIVGLSDSINDLRAEMRLLHEQAMDEVRLIAAAQREVPAMIERAKLEVDQRITTEIAPLSDTHSYFARTLLNHGNRLAMIEHDPDATRS